MLRTMFKSKIHRATVTHADLLPGEQVSVVDIANGSRFETYLIAGERGSGVIGVNGAAAHLAEVGHLVIVISYAQLTDAEARDFVPTVVHVDGRNRIVQIGSDPAAAFTPGVETPPFALT